MSATYRPPRTTPLHPEVEPVIRPASQELRSFPALRHGIHEGNMMKPSKLTGAQWLLKAVKDPAANAKVRRLWDVEGRSALIPTGVHFDAIVLPQVLGCALLNHLEHPMPPVLFVRPRYAFLVPVGAAREWSEPSTRVLGASAWVAAPKPGEPLTDTLSVHVPSWLVAPDGSGLLHDPTVLRAALQATRGNSQPSHVRPIEKERGEIN